MFSDEGHSGAALVRVARKYVYQALVIEELAKAGTGVMFVHGPSSDAPPDPRQVTGQVPHSCPPDHRLGTRPCAGPVLVDAPRSSPAACPTHGRPVGLAASTCPHRKRIAGCARGCRP